MLLSDGYWRISVSQFSTSFSFGPLTPKKQKLLKKYPSPEAILAGFDLDSSRVALLPNGEIVCPRAYIHSVNYGINPIVSCQRINKYYNRYFIPWFPDNILQHLKGTVGELIKYLGKEHNWTKKKDILIMIIKQF